MQKKLPKAFILLVMLLPTDLGIFMGISQKVDLGRPWSRVGDYLN
jgi:hypothetical protein